MIELQILNKILNSKSFQIIIINNLNEDYFSTYKDEFKFIKEHYEKYNVIPDKETFVSVFNTFDFIDVNETDEYLVSKLREEYLYRIMVPHLNKISELMTNGKSNEALTYWQSTTPSLIKETNTKCVDLINDASIRFNNYLERTRNFNKFFYKTGLPELDEILGGWDKNEELALILARTNVGKTWWLIYFALQSAIQGLRVGIYSGEMSENKIGYRLDTFLFNISNWGLVHGDINIQTTYEKCIKNIKERVTGSIKVITPKQLDGQATVSKLRAFIEREDLEILYIDQYSLLSDEHKSKNSIDAFACISKDLKTLQVLKKIPIIIASQLNRGENENEDRPGMRNIAGSDRIGQDATTALFLEQKENNIIITIGKARDAKIGDRLTYSWDINNGELIYIPTEKDATLGKHIKEVEDEFKEDINDNIF